MGRGKINEVQEVLSEYEILYNSLSTQHQIFFEHYIKEFNATEAAEVAKYSKKTARSQGCYLLTKPNIKQLIKLHMETVAKDNRTSHEALTQFYIGVLQTDVHDFIKTTGTGKNRKTVLKTRAEMGGKGKLITSIRIDPKGGTTIKIFSKEQAAEALARHTGYFEEDNAQKAAVGPVVFIPDNGRGDAPEALASGE